MPTEFSNPTVFIPSGNPDAYDEPTLRRAGDLGTRFPFDDKAYGVVKHDSGATAATPTGLAAATQVAYWKDRLNKIVTNDVRFAEEGYNGVAGIYRNAPTPGNYTAILVKGRNINVKQTGAGFLAGDSACANDVSPAADVKRVVAGTAPPTAFVGRVRGPENAGVVPVDISLPWVP